LKCVLSKTIRKKGTFWSWMQAKWVQTLDPYLWGKKYHWKEEVVCFISCWFLAFLNKQNRELGHVRRVPPYGQ
jgi:hypothetical protein